MPAGSPNSRRLERLLRETPALEAQGNAELSRLSTEEIEANLRQNWGGTDNALLPEQQPVYKVFDILQWDLWQKGTEPWPVGCVEVSADIKIKVKSSKVPGKHGSRHVNRGKQHTEVEIKVKLWTKVHFAAYTEVAQRYGKNLPVGKTGSW